MQKQNTLLMLLLWVATWSAAQPANSNDIIITEHDSTNGGLVPRRMILSRDGGFLRTGSMGTTGYLSKTSSCGQLLWTRQYLLGDRTALNSVAELPSGEIVAAGTCHNCVVGDTTWKALVLQTDAKGSLLRDTAFGNAQFDAQANDIIITSSGKIAATGHAYGSGFLTPSDAFLIVLNGQLHTEIWKSLNHAYLDRGSALTQTNDGGFLIAGRSIPALFAPTQAQLFRTNANGNLLWKFTSPYTNSDFVATRQAGDGRLVALGKRQVDTLVHDDVFLAAFDPASGALLTEKTYGSPADDAGRSLERIAGGYLVGATYGAPSAPNWNRRDWVFRLDEQFNLVDQYFRDDYLFAHELVNAVPLSADGKAFAYESVVHFFEHFNRLFFKRTFSGVRANFTRTPQHFQLVPRNLGTNKGQVVFQGNLPEPDTYDRLQLEILRNGSPYQVLEDSTAQSFEFAPEIPAELAEYTFRLFGQKGLLKTLETEACNVVAGDVYLIQGQSNALAGIPYDPDNVVDHAYRHHRSPFVRNFGLRYGPDSLYVWHKEDNQEDDYVDNLSGQWGLVLGKQIVDTYGIPVAILNGAISGIPIDEMMPDPQQHDNPATHYGRFLRRVEQSGLRQNVRALMMFQGETNAGPAYYDSANNYYQKFVQLDQAWKQDFPAVEQRYLFQIRPGAYWIGATLHTCLQIEEAQRRIPQQLPNWQVMSTTGMNHDSTHYFYPNGFERAGNDLFRLVARDLYQVPGAANMYPPAVEEIRFSHCNRRQLTLRLRATDDTYTWYPGWESDFYLEGASAIQVTSGQVVGNAIVLNLSAAPGAGFSGLSYTAHPGGDKAPVKNARGIGMLTFYKFPVLPYDLAATALGSASRCFGASDGAAAGLAMGGGGPYAYAWSNGSASALVQNLTAGTYTLTITDTANGCTAVAQALVTQPPLSTGNAMLAGCAGSTVQLPDGSTVTQSGNYAVTLTNATGCDSIVTCLVTISDPISLLDTLIIPAVGTAPGAISLNPAGGNPPYTYHWNTGQNSPSVSGLVGGLYTVTVTDAQDCSGAFVLTVPVILGTTQFPDAPEVEFYPNPCAVSLFIRVPDARRAGSKLRIIDLTGREIWSTGDACAAQWQVSVDNWPTGSYILQVLFPGGRLWTGKFIKQ